LNPWVGFWMVFTLLGTEAFYVLFCTFLYVSVDRDLALKEFSAVLLSASIVLLLKQWLRLPRPPRSMWLVEAHGYGFPSGHAGVSSAFWFTLALEKASPLLAALAVVLVALISASRLALHVHYPRDIAGGLAIGTLIAVLIHYAGRRMGRNLPLVAGIIAAGLSAASLLQPADMHTLYSALAVMSISIIVASYPVMIEDAVRSAPTCPKWVGVLVAVVMAAAALAINKFIYPPLLFTAAYMGLGAAILLSPKLLCRPASTKQT